MSGTRERNVHAEGHLPVMRPLLPSPEALAPYLARIHSNRIYSNFGPLEQEFGARLAEGFALPPGRLVCAGSGTAALIGAILATAGRATPERPIALVPALTFAATALAAQACGYDIRLVDVDADSWRLDPARLAGHPALEGVGLILPVAPFGRAVVQEPWARFRADTGVAVVIDAAAAFENLLARPERYLGEVPVAVSFHATKSFSCGEGGCVVTGDEEQARRVALSLNFGLYRSRECEGHSINGKLSEYHAAVGLAELDQWPEKSAALSGVASKYRRVFTSCEPSGDLHTAPGVASCYALLECESREAALNARRRLDQAAIGHRQWYGDSLDRHGFLADRPQDAMPCAQTLANRLIGLPVAPDLAEEQIERVARTLESG